MSNPIKLLYNRIMPKYEEPKQIGRSEYWIMCFKSLMNTSWNNFTQSYNSFFLTSALFAGWDYEKDIAPVLVVLGVVNIVLGYVVSPIVGMLVARTETKWGRYRPYLALSMLPVMILNIMAFWCPGGLTRNGAIIYHFARTLLATAFGYIYNQGENIRQVITGNSEERKNLIALTSIINSAAYAVPVILVKLFSYAFEQLIQLYFVLSIVISALMLLANVLCFIFSRERIPYTPAKVKLNTATLEPFKHKPFLIYQVSTWFQQLGISGLVTTYLAAVVVGEENYVKFAIPTAVGTIVGLLVCNVFLRIGIQAVTMMRFVGVYCLSVAIILTIIGPFAGTLFYVFYFMFGMTFGFFNVLPGLIQADVNDYLEWKTGQRIEAASSVFADYIKNGIRSVVTQVVFPYMLVWAGYQAASEVGQSVYDANLANQERTARILLFYMAVITGAGYFLGSIAYWFYDLSGEKKQRMLDELKVSREQISEERTTVDV